MFEQSKEKGCWQVAAVGSGARRLYLTQKSLGASPALASLFVTAIEDKGQEIPSVGFHSPGWAECLSTGNPIPISANFQPGAAPVRDLDGDVWWGILPDAA